MNENIFTNSCKYGAIGSFLCAILATLCLVLSEMNMLGGRSFHDTREFAVMIIFCSSIIFLGCSTVGILLNTEIIAKEMRIQRFLRQEKLIEREEEHE